MIRRYLFSKSMSRFSLFYVSISNGLILITGNWWWLAILFPFGVIDFIMEPKEQNND